MEKNFHVFFLFTLFMFFSVSMAFDREMQLETDPETGELYFDWNKNQQDTIDRWGTIPLDVKSFKLTSKEAYGDILLEAPEMRKLIVSGEISPDGSYNWNKLYDAKYAFDSMLVYMGYGDDGCVGFRYNDERDSLCQESGACSELDSLCDEWGYMGVFRECYQTHYWGRCVFKENFEIFLSRGRYMFLELGGVKSMNLTVEVVPIFYPYTLTFDYVGANVSGRNNYWNEFDYFPEDSVVEFFVEPYDKYSTLNGVSAKDSEGNDIEVEVVEPWYHHYAFIMPESTDVIVDVDIVRNVKAVQVSKIPQQKYTGEPIKPSVTVMDKSKKLVENTNYSVTYSDNTDVGVATVTITGLGKYVGSKTVQFEIVEEQTTSIGRMEKRLDRIKVGTGFDLKGRELHGAPQAPGVYYGQKNKVEKVRN